MLPLAVRALLFVLLALVPAALVQMLLEGETRQQRAEQLAGEATQFARLVAGQQSRTIEGAQSLLSAMAAHDAIRAGRTNPECETYLRRLLADHPRFVSMSSFDLAGHVVCSGTPVTPGVSLEDRRYFQSIRDGGAFAVGDFTEGRGTGRRTLHLAAPLRDAAGALLGGVVAGLSIEWLSQDLATLPLPEDATALLLDRAGMVLARTNGQPLPAVGRDAVAFAQPRILMEGLPDDMGRMVASMPIGPAGSGLIASVGLSVERGLTDEMTRERRASLLVFGSLLLTLLLAFGAFHRGVDRPVQKLLTTAQAWSAQNWNARIGSIGGGAELERIGGALDLMADRLQQAEAARLAAATRVKALSDVSPQVVFTADAGGRLDWFNGYWRQYTGMSLADSQGVGWLRAVHHRDRRSVIAAWRAAIASRGTCDDDFNLEIRLCHAPEKAWRWFFLRASPIRDDAGHVTSWAGVALDFHDLRQAREALAEQSERLRATYQSAPVGLCLLDPELRFLAINAVLAESNGASPDAHIGRSLAAMAPHVAPLLEPHLRHLFASGEPIRGFEIRGAPVCPPTLRRVWLCSYQPVRGADGSIQAATGSVLEISELKGAEESQRLLSREVDHRAKNVLAVVRSLVRVSAIEAPNDVDSFVEVLEGRIAAMARVHTLLSQAGWGSIELGEILREETAAHQPQVTLEGPGVRLAPEAAQPFTMVVHELMTNALKHGALSNPLSNPLGKVRVRWCDDGKGIRLEWTEEGGPPISNTQPPEGFGTQLIDGNASTPLDGTLERHWERTGLRCVLRIGAGALALVPEG